MDLKYKFLICALLFLKLGMGQDSTYIRTFPEKITVRLGLQNTANSFTLQDSESNITTEFIPNDKTYLGLSLLFRSIELDLGYAPSFLSENQDNEGSKLFTLNFRMFLGQWMQTLDFYNQEGFFIESGEEIISFPELNTLKIGGSTSYIFNRRFSFRAIGFQNEWQKKSAGSFIPRLTYYYTRFGIDGSSLKETNDHSIDIAIGPGYYYNLIIAKHFIASAGATVGIGLNFSTSQGETTTSELAQFAFRTALGYNSEKVFTGINLNAQVLAHAEDETTQVDDNIAFVELYLGYRFNAPKKWVQKADNFNKKFGLD
ncbi:DUF4421 domain-containing protein [Maribacter aestuarii]|uniref:DUF4421 domain-containing protein n=1 Tax=Maribacter aestuarii TaxID=1130723 RepID=UPI00248D16F2|nr:DUF4421 domain-containing protein [Maribacter aestuarii]